MRTEPHFWVAFFTPFLWPTLALATSVSVLAITFPADHIDIAFFAVGTIIALLTFRWFTVDIDDRDRKRHEQDAVDRKAHEEQQADWHAKILSELEHAQKYPASVAGLYGPIRYEMERMKAAVAALQRDAHTHDLGIPVRPHQIPPSRD